MVKSHSIFELSEEEAQGPLQFARKHLFLVNNLHSIINYLKEKRRDDISGDGAVMGSGTGAALAVGRTRPLPGATSSLVVDGAALNAMIQNCEEMWVPANGNKCLDNLDCFVSYEQQTLTDLTDVTTSDKLLNQIRSIQATVLWGRSEYIGGVFSGTAVALASMTFLTAISRYCGPYFHSFENRHIAVAVVITYTGHVWFQGFL